MIRLLVLILTLTMGLAHAAASVKWVPPIKFELVGEPVSQVVNLIYSEAIKSAYVLDPAVLADSRPVSFRYESAKGQIKPFLAAFLDAMGYEVARLGAVDYIKPKPQAVPVEPASQVFVYRVAYRDGSYLADLLGPLFKGSFTVKRLVRASPGAAAPVQSVPSTSAAAAIDRASDTLVFQGSPKEVKLLQTLLPKVDIPTGEVMVRAVVYEVQTGADDGSAFTLAASLLKGKLGLSFGPAAALDSVLSIKTADFSAIASVLATDSRFKVITSPSTRVRSGSQARFVVGQDVPMLGSLSYPQGAGQAVQSISYQSSGVIFQVTPEVRGGVVDVDLSQQISSFVNTTTGVNNSPTLDKRQLDTSISVKSGDVIVLGGLTEDKSTDSSSGVSFLPSFLRSKTGSKSRSEIMMLLQVNKI